MAPKPRTVEQELARLASRSHGVVTRGQLLRAGITSHEIKSRVRTGSLLTQHRGVYRVGHAAPSVEASYLAAVLACGPGALLAGPAAAHLHRLLRSSPPMPEVLTPTERQIPGVRSHRSRAMDRRDAAKVRGIPITTVARTLTDLAAVLSVEALALACHEAGILHRTTPRHVDAVLARRPNSPGAANLRMVMRGDVHVILSRLERRFIRVLREVRLPLPITNRVASARRVDCRWPEHRLTIELDSYTFHNSRHSWEQDRRREREAYARGDQFRRYTWGDVFEDSGLMLIELHSLLS